MLVGEDHAAFRPSFPLVDAKLRKPVLRPWIVRRDRLVRRLLAEPWAPVVSVVAPAGYGKTILLADWASRERRPISWLTIDDFDNEPSVFLTYLAAALARLAPIDPEVGRAIGSSRARLLATAVPRLAAALHRIDGPSVLILDDAHRLVDRTCLDALAALIDHLPEGFQVAVAGRSAPDLHLARIRARRDLLEIGTSELALDAEETRRLAAAAGRSLTAGQADDLRKRTEGWATGIYLATLADSRSFAPGRGSVMVSGQDPAIADYLRSELLSTLGDEDQTFLTRVSILEVVEPAVADAVTGMGGAAERLRVLARENRLVAPLAGGAPSYRLHQVLSEYLRAELDRREPGSATELHRRAAGWFERAGRVDVAVEHALAAADELTAARLVASIALPMHYAGHTDLLDRWIRTIQRGDLRAAAATRRRRRAGERPQREGGGRGATRRHRGAVDVRRDARRTGPRHSSRPARSCGQPWLDTGPPMCSRPPSWRCHDEPATSPWRPLPSTVWPPRT